jgi:outer membrane protein TolC
MIDLDISTARAAVAARESAILQAYRAMKDQENFLKQLVTADLIPLLGTDVEIAAPKEPSFYDTVITGVKEALELRPDYQQAKLDVANRHITVVVQKNALLPRLDLSASLSLIGVDDSFGTSLSRGAANRDQYNWSAGASFSYPIGNRDARGRYNAATLESAQSLVRLQQLEQNIIVSVDNANGAIVTARERIVSDAEAARFAKESLDATEKRYAAGTVTIFDVLNLQNRLSEAETAELRSRADYSNAIARYQQETGTTLRVHGINID